MDEIARVTASLNAHTSSSGSAAMRLCCILAGGGARAVGYLLARSPGASSTVMECEVPHAHEAVLEPLGGEAALQGDGYVSVRAAELLARSAHARARALLRKSGREERTCGIAATAALATSREKKGAHRAFIAASSTRGTGLWSLRLDASPTMPMPMLTGAHEATASTRSGSDDGMVKRRRSRWEEDDIVSRAVVKAAAAMYNSFDGAAIDDAIDLGLYETEAFEGGVNEYDVDDAIRLVLEETVDEDIVAQVRPIPGSERPEVLIGMTSASVLLAGSFNPLHIGHTRLLRAATANGESASFELSVSNADKGLLDFYDVRRRVQQFLDAGETLVLSRRPLYADKARAMPGRSFAVGFDTAVRIVNPKYYGGDEAGLSDALEDFRARGCRFRVGGRMDKDTSEWKDMRDVDIPSGFADIFESIPESEFREDISSTELRAAGKGLV